MNNLYPYAGCEFQLDLHSAGSVPFHIAITKFTVEQWNSTTGTWNALPAGANLPWTRGFPSTDGAGHYTGDGPENQCFSFFNADWKGPIPGQINLGNTTAGAPIQVHPAPASDLVCNFKLVLDENWKTGSGSSTDPNQYVSNQGLSFRVTAEYTAYQWNEQPSAALLTSINP
jgi:hypothetical protein